MNAIGLLGWIVAALLLQLAVGIGVVVRRRHAAAPATPARAAATKSRPELAWEGWREFRVARRSFEDAARTQCSFYLEPVDGRPLPAFRPGQSRPGVPSRAAIRCRTGPTRRTTA